MKASYWKHLLNTSLSACLLAVGCCAAHADDLDKPLLLVASPTLQGPYRRTTLIAVQIGGISAMAPSRRADLARLGMRAMLAGTLATFLTASIAGALLTDEDAERDYRKNRARVAPTAAAKIEQYDVFLGKYPGSPFAPEFRELKSRVK